MLGLRSQMTIILEANIMTKPTGSSEAFASVTTYISKSWKAYPGAVEEYEMTSRLEEEIPVQSLVTQSEDQTAVVAKVTSSVGTKVSEAVYWGSDKWDKVPYAVEVFTSVSLSCDQDADTIAKAQRMAYDLAWKSSRESIGKAVVGHDTDIRERLYPGLFSEET
jgi:hypothetical protein